MASPHSSRCNGSTAPPAPCLFRSRPVSAPGASRRPPSTESCTASPSRETDPPDRPSLAASADAPATGGSARPCGAAAPPAPAPASDLPEQTAWSDSRPLQSASPPPPTTPWRTPSSPPPPSPDAASSPAPAGPSRRRPAASGPAGSDRSGGPSGSPVPPSHCLRQPQRSPAGSRSRNRPCAPPRHHRPPSHAAAPYARLRGPSSPLRQPPPRPAESTRSARPSVLLHPIPVSYKHLTLPTIYSV